MSVRLRGAAVELRPLREEEFDVLLAEEIGDTEPDPVLVERTRGRIATSGTWQPGELLLAVDADGSIIGTCQIRRAQSAFPPGVFELGIGLFEQARGKGYGTDVIATLARYLFEEEGAIRVQLGTDVHNAAMRRAAEKAGYRFEGVMRSFWETPDEEPHDYALYARTLADHRDGPLPPVEVRGDRVSIGALDADALDPMLRELRRFRPEMDAAEVRRRIAASGRWGDHDLFLGIRRDGSTIGTVQAAACPRLQFPGTFEIGVVVFDEANRGQGLGSEAVALLTGYLFDEMQAHRVSLTTDVDNVAMHRSAAKLGFRYEGTMRAAYEGDHGPVDQDVFAMTRRDHEHANEEHRWTRTS
ncbi:MAG TPA: GNAT family protein [Actinomycetota bacterium]|nr:GNAT family protein [Actinomycetota bacterium]